VTITLSSPMFPAPADGATSVRIAPVISEPVTGFGTAVVVPRCNFAGFCMYCGLRACQDSECIRSYTASFWAVCETCGGAAADEWGTRCPAHCMLGVIEVFPDTPGAVSAASWVVAP